MRRRWMLLAEMIALVFIIGWAAYSLTDSAKPPGSVGLKVQLRDARNKVYLYKDAQGRLLYRLRLDNGKDLDLTPQDFAGRIYHDQNDRGWFLTLLNVSSPVEVIWVTVGLLGQVLFTGRMIVQWLASEKSKRSVVPPVFWWMSLGGSTMLLVYFIWRMDAVGVLGQAFGWFIYVRNLWLIYSPTRPKAAAGEDPAPEAELGR